ncbi:MAG: HaeII family restriction endonuclease [Planctomycetaceae bacterium]|jgi:type II restriction enzyme|nr:HaeII family restriction endonuclease [Planctomycetaceae bacterium]
MPNEAKNRLDALIKKSRADLYKPLAVAEILYRHRLQDLDINDLQSYRRKSYEWMREVILFIHRKTTALNSRYWDQMFDDSVLPPKHLQQLAEINRQYNGIVEVYIYAHIKAKFSAFAQLRQTIELASPETFSLDTFLGFFENNAKYRGSIDKAYEIAVYALFNALVTELKAKVTLSVDKNALPVLQEFEDFSRLVLGCDTQHLTITQSAQLFRVGTANANDAGLDMWANFGPAVQVKHLSLQPTQVVDICNGVRAEQVVIVCKSCEATSIHSLLMQLGLSEKLRGIITEKDLEKWYAKCRLPQYRNTLGKSVIASIIQEMKLEFPLSESEVFDKFFRERNYDTNILGGEWQLI